MNKWILTTTAIILFSSCNQNTNPPSKSNTIAIQKIDQNKNAFEKTFKTLDEITSKLESNNVHLNLDKAILIANDSIDNYLIPTNSKNITVNILKNKSGNIENISLIKTTGMNITVNNLFTGAVIILLKDNKDIQVIKSGYTDFRPGHLTEIISDHLIKSQKSTTSTSQSNTNIPQDLLQKKEQAKNDVSNYQEQVAIATVAVVAASGSVIVTCGATTVTVGVSTSACLASGAALATAYTNSQEKLRQLNDANIRLNYAQKAIEEWKSNHPSKN